MICERMPQTHIGSLCVDGARAVSIQGTLVAISRTACALGGSRPWFLCPSCDRQCAILYPTRCRVCLKLHYASEHESPLDRQFRAAFKVREKLGQRSGGIVAMFPAKPKHMRWHTYLNMRSVAKLNEAQLIKQLRRW